MSYLGAVVADHGEHGELVDRILHLEDLVPGLEVLDRADLKEN